MDWSASGLFHSFVWHWSDRPHNLEIYRKAHCKTMLPMSGADFMKYILPVIRPNPALGEIKPTSDARWKALSEQFNQRSPQAHMGSSETGEAIHSRIGYTFHGVAEEENLAIRMICAKKQTGNYRGPVPYPWDTVAMVITQRAPQGQFDAAMDAIGPILNGSAGYTREWKQQAFQATAAMSQRVSAAMTKQSDGEMGVLQQMTPS